MNKVKIGDKIYLKEFGYLKGREEVIKITKTMIITKNHRFRYEEGNSALSSVGADRFCHTYGYLETPELRKEGEEIMLKNWLRKNWEKFTADQIRKIKPIIEEDKTKL